MKALVTGSTGFAGRYLVTELERRGYAVSGWIHRTQLDRASSFVQLVQGDLLDAATVRTAVKTVRPDAIFHLAAQASVPRAWADPAGTLMINQIGLLNLIQAVLDLALQPRILVCGSNEEYGLVRPEDLPLHEASPLRPANPYAVSKIAQNVLGFQYFLSHRLPIIRVRPFNHTGPGQSPVYVVPSIAQQVAEIELGRREAVIRTGDPSARRDFTDVRDMVRGYVDLLERGTPGEVYNLGSGRSRSIADLIEIYRGLAKVAFAHEIDPALRRPVDVPDSVCDASKARRAVGWQPLIPLEETLAAILDEWRAAVRETSHA